MPLPLPAARTVAAIVLAAACGADGVPDHPDDPAAFRDSAGVTVVEHGPDAAERVPRWVVGPEPALAIGVTDGEPAYQFYYALDAAFLSDGRIAVLDWGSRQVRLFGSDGGLVGVQGREGDGPGEYRSPQMLWALPGDSIAVYDTRLARITVLATGPNGPGLARVAPVRRGILAPLAAGALDGGRRLVVLHRPVDGATPIQPRMGALLALSIDGVAADSLMALRHGSYGRLPAGEELGVTAGFPIFGGLSGWAMADGDRLAWGTGQAYQVEVAEVRGPEGRMRTRRVIRWDGPDRAVTDEDVSRWIDSVVARARPERRALERRGWEATPVADARPAHGRLLFDAAGRLWVNRWDLWTDHLNDGPGWWVFDREGRMVATARMPAGFRAFDFGDDVVLGRIRDPLGVERVVVMPLTRADP